jgi:hypothetical protein
MPFSNESLCHMPYAHDGPTLDAADRVSRFIPL